MIIKLINWQFIERLISATIEYFGFRLYFFSSSLFCIDSSEISKVWWKSFIGWIASSHYLERQRSKTKHSPKCPQRTKLPNPKSERNIKNSSNNMQSAYNDWQPLLKHVDSHKQNNKLRCKSYNRQAVCSEKGCLCSSVSAIAVRC